MAHSSWGSGWPNCNSSRMGTLTRSDGLKIPLHRDLIPLTTKLIDITESRGYNLVPGWCWGYSCRAIRGTNRPSNHSWGTAIDINAPNNPQGSRLVTDMPGWMVDLWTANGFRWGGTYNSRPDAMHYEFMGTVSEAQEYARRLGGTSSPSGPTLPSYPGVSRRGDKGEKVRLWQAVLKDNGFNVAVDGDYGPATEAAAKEAQRFYKLTVDGVLGEASWHALIQPGGRTGGGGGGALPTYPGVARMGDKGEKVRVWQAVYNDNGYQLKVDGDYGQATNHVARHFQERAGLDVDGVSGPATWHALVT